MLGEKEKDIILEKAIALCKLIIFNKYIIHDSYSGEKSIIIIGVEKITRESRRNNK